MAELDGEIVGHVISTRGWVGDLELLGLGPIGVVPRLQRHGIGTALMNETVARANAAGERRHRPAGQPRVLLPLRLRAVHLARRGAAGGRLGRRTSSCFRWPSGPAACSGTFRYAAPLRADPAGDGIPLTGRPSSPIGRGSGLKIRVLWVRVPPGVHIPSFGAPPGRA